MQRWMKLSHSGSSFWDIWTIPQVDQSWKSRMRKLTVKEFWKTWTKHWQSEYCRPLLLAKDSRARACRYISCYVLFPLRRRRRRHSSSSTWRHHDIDILSLMSCDHGPRQLKLCRLFSYDDSKISFWYWSVHQPIMCGSIKPLQCGNRPFTKFKKKTYGRDMILID